MSEKALLTLEEAAAYLRVSARTVERLVSPTTVRIIPLRHVHIGGEKGLLRFRRSDLDYYVDRLARASVPAPPPPPPEKRGRAKNTPRAEPLSLAPPARVGNMRPIPIDLPVDADEGLVDWLAVQEAAEREREQADRELADTPVADVAVADPLDTMPGMPAWEAVG